MVPNRIGVYRIDSRLGAGGMGEVYRAWDESLERWVALKFIRGDRSESSTIRERFRREAQAAAGLSHPAIVKIFHVLPHGDDRCIVMEHVEGQTLAALLQDGPLDPDRAVRLLRGVAEGLAEAHDHGIVHRDLKVENVMVDQGDRPKILDFGLAKRVASSEVSLSLEGAVLGTLHCMSPEQAQGREAEASSDLFSLGVLAYHLLTGESPFRGVSVDDTLVRILRVRQRPAQEVSTAVSRELSDLVDQLLEKDPKNRPAGAADVVAALDRMTGTMTAVEREKNPESEIETVLEIDPADIDPVDVDQVLRSRSDDVTLDPAGSVSEPSLTESSLSDLGRRRGARATLVLGVVVGVLLLAAFLVAWWLRSTLPMTVAVLGFENQTGRPNDPSGLVVRTIVEDGLVTSSEIRVVDGRRVAEVLRGLEIDSVDRLDGQNLESLQDLLGAGYFVTGSYARQGDRLSFRPRLMDARGRAVYDGELLEHRTGLMELGERMILRIRAGLGLDEMVADGGSGSDASLPTDPKALELYARGLEKQRSGHLYEARDLLQRAVAKEAENSRLWHTFSGVLADLGETLDAEQAIRSAGRHSGHLSRWRQLEIQARSCEITGTECDAVELRQTIQRQRPGVFRNGLNVVQAQVRAGQYDDAQATIFTLRDLADTERDSGWLDLVEAWVRFFSNEIGGSLDLASRAAQAGRNSWDKRLEAEALLLRARASTQRHEHEDALQDLSKAQPLFERLDHAPRIIDVLTHQAFLLDVSGRTAEARRRLDRSLLFFREKGNSFGEARVAVNLAVNLVESGELERGEQLLHRALEIFMQKGARRQEALARINLGSTFQDVGKLAQAEVQYAEALRLLEALGQEEEQERIKVLANFGELAYQSGDLNGAEEKYRRALAVAADRYPGEEAYLRYRLGQLLTARGDLEEAHGELEAAAAAQREIEPSALLDTRLAQAELEIHRSNFGQARDLATAVRDQALESELPDLAILAQAVYVRALLATGAPVDAQTARDRWTLTRFQADGHAHPKVRFASAVLSVRMDVLEAQAPESQIVRDAVESLLEVIREAESIRQVDAFEARLTLAEIRQKQGEDADLDALVQEARAQGWELVARRAEALAHGS